jgi:exodeoxyribonuclease-3
VKIVTWNVNSIRVRMPILLDWLHETTPDVVLLLETKCKDALFPAAAIAARIYTTPTGGAAPHTGVATLPPRPLEAVQIALRGDPADLAARYLEAPVEGVGVAPVYVPTGTEVASDRFAFKLAYFDRLRAHAAKLLELGEPFVIGGDYNVAPTPADVYDADELDGTICYHPAEREKFRALTNLGLYDAFRAVQPNAITYSWWHYQNRAFQLGHGLRIDHLLLSPEALDRLDKSDVDDRPRRLKSPSDHAPVWCTLAA